jgi:autotransporter passenger strand-loop-strand repeat protein
VVSGPSGLGIGAVVNSGGEEDVAGGFASATTINSGGMQAVSASTTYASQGVTESSIINGGFAQIA